MKSIINKCILVVVLLLSLSLVGCIKSNDELIVDEAFYTIQIPEIIVDDLDLPSETKVNGEVVKLVYNTNSEVLENDGTVHPYVEDDENVDITVTISYNGKTYTRVINDRVVASMKRVCEKVSDEFIIYSDIWDDIDLPEYIGKVKCKWNSSNIDLISKEGKTSYVSKDQEVSLTCTYLYKSEDDSYKLEEEYDVVLHPWTSSKRIGLVKKDIDIPTETISDIELPLEFDYDVKCKWTSSNQDAITKIGNVTRNDKDELVTLTLLLYCENDSSYNEEITYEVKVLKAINVEGEMNFYRHILVNRARDLNTEQMTGLVYNEKTQRIELKSDALTGVYESDIYNTLDFYRIVGSFACTTSEKATAELEYSIKVNGVWSKFLSYGQFGIGRKNVYYDQYDTYAMIDTDMVIPLNNNVGKAFKYRITLRRDSLSIESPALSLIASAIFINNYNYAVDTSELPNSVDWDVPKLNQNIVPKIGNVICSATTTTMLLKYAGYDFSDKGYKYEHEYMAGIVADTGHNNPTYGNWSYNMMAAGGFGANAYVGKYYSWDEIRYHLANYGPIGTSIGGNFGRYTTQGHLIVLRGYRIVNGETTVICNDPNIDEVYYEVPLETFLRCMGSVVYILEYDKEIINFK